MKFIISSLYGEKCVFLSVIYSKESRMSISEADICLWHINIQALDLFLALPQAFFLRAHITCIDQCSIEIAHL